MVLEYLGDYFRSDVGLFANKGHFDTALVLYRII